MKCQHQILNIYCKGYSTDSCKREAKYRLTYLNGSSECVCGYCKNGIIRSIKSEWFPEELERLKIEKLNT